MRLRESSVNSMPPGFFDVPILKPAFDGWGDIFDALSVSGVFVCARDVEVSSVARSDETMKMRGSIFFMQLL